MSRIIALFALVALLGGCSHLPAASGGEGRINHLVLIWLKESGNTEQRQQVIEASRALEQIPGVIKIRAGSVMPSERAIVDDSFDVGVHMLFADRQSMERYTAAPEHLQIVKERVMPLAKKLVIYDFEE